MNQQKVPNWMFVAVVAGLCELTYYLYTHFGTILPTRISFIATLVAAVVVGIILSLRTFRRRKA